MHLHLLSSYHVSCTLHALPALTYLFLKKVTESFHFRVIPISQVGSSLLWSFVPTSLGLPKTSASQRGLDGSCVSNYVGHGFLSICEHILWGL